MLIGKGHSLLADGSRYPAKIVGGRSTGAPPPSYLIYDEFIPGLFPPTALTAHDIAPTNVPGTAWAEVPNAYGLFAVKLGTFPLWYRAAGTRSGENFYENVLDAGVADCTITANIYGGLESTWQVGFLLRFAEYYDKYWIIAESTGKLSLYKRYFSTTLLAQADLPSAPAGDTLTVTLSGSSISATLLGVTILATDSHGATNTKHGLYIHTSELLSSVTSIDNFAVV